MGNYDVYVTVKNKTHETLRYGWSSQASGKWKDMPSAIKANKDASFTLEDTDWFTGTEGAFSYSINDDQKLITSISMYQTDPYAHDNVIVITDLPHPEAVYSLSYRSSVNDDKHWKDNQVSPDGHPLYIEYTIDYERKKHYRFQLLQITANSDHPVRNSRNRTVVGSHTLWDPSNSNKDGTVGSYEPNVFAYDFKSLVTETGFVNVKVQPMDPELSGAEVILIGSIGGKELLKSDYFFFKGPNQPITVTAHVVGILTSDHPFSLNGDVDWSVHLRQSDEKLQRYGDGVTRLELYWIAKNRHRAFNDFIPINFLRLVLKADQLKGAGAQTETEKEGGKLVATFTYWYQQKTNEVFDAYNKQYDVFNGASHFNVTLWGGNFWLTRYTDGGGTSNPIVNCQDQAGMLELACSLYTKATSWLCVQPFGYINQTHLVGIKDYHGTFYEINNPFFGNNPDRALVPPDANDRQAFRCHAFNGDSLAWTNSSNQGVYDACGGPHAGTRNIVDYLDNDIDRTTPLYQRYPLRCPWPATAGEVIKAVGVEAIDGPPMFVQQRDNSAFPHLEADAKLISTVFNNPAAPLAYVGWPRLPTWLKSTLGDAWDVRYEQITVGANVAQAFWEISELAARDSPISINVTVFSAVTDDGHLDIERSAAAAKDHIGDIIMSTQRIDAWTSGILPGIGHYLKYADHIPAGRIILTSGNAVMDIRGLPSTEILLPHALKLFNQTSRPDNASYLTLPVLQRHAILIPGSDLAATLTPSQDGPVKVAGIHTRFYVVFKVDRKIVTAKAGCDGPGVLFDRYAVKDEEEGKEENGSEVAFFFIAHQVGRHRIRVSVADAETMLSTFSEFEVEVTDA